MLFIFGVAKLKVLRLISYRVFVYLSHGKTKPTKCASTEDSDQPKHQSSGTIIFVVCMKKASSCFVMLAFWSPSTAAYFAFFFTCCD